MGIPGRKTGQHHTSRDSRAWPEDDVDPVVQPDLVVTCARDYREKFSLDERSGVKEYGLVHPASPCRPLLL